jgi:hypothetical protein
MIGNPATEESDRYDSEPDNLYSATHTARC